MSLSRAYFELQPINNVVEFSFDAGQDVINFIVPSVNNAMLDSLQLSGTLQVNTATSTPYQPGDIIIGDNTTSKEFGVDNVIGIHGAISKIELNSRRANTSLEQQLNYDIVAKVDRAATLNEEDANVGENDNMNCGSSLVRGSMNKLTRQANPDDGVPFCVPLNVGLLNKASAKIALQKIGGFQVSIFLNSTKQFLFNLDNTYTNKLGSESTYTLKNMKLFGRYQFVPDNVYNGAVALPFKQTSNSLQIVQSSNDTIVNTPMVSALDNVVCVAMPNNTTRNNFEKCGTQLNEIIGQRAYKVGRNGLQYPYDYEIQNVESTSNKKTTTGNESVQAGSAEAVLHQCIALNGVYPPYHTMAGPRNETEANAGLYANNNENVNNLRTIALSYQYGFRGFTTNFQSDQIDLQIRSAVKTTNAELPQAPLDQTQTLNCFNKYNSVLSYANLQVAK
jgi:hypothetical protein